LTEKLPSSSPFHTHMSYFPLLNCLPFIICINSCSCAISHAICLLLHTSFHSQLFSFHSPSSSIVLFLQFDIANNLGNLWLSGKSPTHLSSQNLIVVLVPTVQSMLLSNQLFCCLPQIPYINHSTCYYPPSLF